MKLLVIILVSLAIFTGCTSRHEAQKNTEEWKYIIDDYRYIENFEGTRACLMLWTGIKTITNMETIGTQNFKYYKISGRVEIDYEDGSRVIWNEGLIELNQNDKVIVIK